MEEKKKSWTLIRLIFPIIIETVISYVYAACKCTKKHLFRKIVNMYIFYFMKSFLKNSAIN